MENLLAEQDQDEIIIKCCVEEMAKAFFKDYEIIWHDPHVDSPENQQYMAQLEKLCKVKTFTEWEEADKYIKNAKTICHVITSGTNGELLVKEIFSSQNVPKILTFCRDEVSHSAWAKSYEKILSTETKIEGVISQIQKNLLEWQKQTSSLKLDLPAFAPIFDDSDKSDMNHLHHYLKVIPNFNNRAQAKKDLLNLSKEVYTNEENKKLIADFERIYDEYLKETILNWYTRQSFVYRVINNCLRIATSDSIQYCRFLLKDVEKAIKDQYQKKSKNFSGLLYRGAYLSEEEWSDLKANVNREIEMHGFLSVTKDEKIALKFMKGDPSKKVFITILVPKGPNEEEQGFAEVEEFSEFPEEQEVLFNVRSRFTVLETNDGGSKDSSYRHLVLLYGAQGLRKYVAEKNPLHQVSIEDFENISGSRCQGPPSEMTEKMLFKSLRDSTKPVYSCKGCLDPNLAPFLCIPLRGKIPTNIKGCLLMNPRQTQILLYGYKCSKCGVKNQKGYFVCTDCSEKKMKWCENCFEDSLSCIETGHSVILETSPFSFWHDKMSENELNHLRFQDHLVHKRNEKFQQAKMYLETQEYEKAIEYCRLYIEQNEAKGKDINLGTSYQIIGSVYHKKGEYTKAIQYHLKSLDISKSVYGEKTPDTAASYNNIAVAYEQKGEYAKVLEYHSKSLDISKSVYGENHPEVATSYSNIGFAFQRQGKYNKALEYHLKSLNIFKFVYGENHPDTAGSYNNIAVIYQRQGAYPKALEYHLKSLGIYKTIYGEKNPKVATSYRNIGLVSQRQGEYKKALEYHLKSLDICKSVYGENHPDTADSYNSIAMVYTNQGAYPKALEYHLKSLDIRKSFYGENHPDTASSYNNIAVVYQGQGEGKKAIEYQLKSLGISKSVNGENHPDTAHSYNNIASLYGEQGDHVKALEYHFKSLDIRKLFHKRNHPEVAISYNNIGFVFERQGEHNKALECYIKSRDIFKSVYGENHPDTASCYSNIAVIYHRQRAYVKALEYNLKSLDIRKSFYGENHPDIATSFHHIGQVYRDHGEYEKALEFYIKSLGVSKSIYGENHIDVATSYESIGSVYFEQGQYSRSLEYDLKSLNIYKSVYGEIHPEIAASYNNIAVAYNNQGDYTKALEYHLKSLDISKLVYGEIHPKIADSYNKIGSIYEKQEKYKKALEYFLKSLGTLKSIHGEDDSLTATLLEKISKVESLVKNETDLKSSSRNLS